jgi:hypothetical protein
MAMKHEAAVGGNMLVVTYARAEMVAAFVIGSTEPVSGGEALEPAHTSDSAFDAPVILLEPVVPTSAAAVGHPRAQR